MGVEKARQIVSAVTMFGSVATYTHRLAVAGQMALVFWKQMDCVVDIVDLTVATVVQPVADLGHWIAKWFADGGSIVGAIDDAVGTSAGLSGVAGLTAIGAVFDLQMSGATGDVVAVFAGEGHEGLGVVDELEVAVLSGKGLASSSVAYSKTGRITDLIAGELANAGEGSEQVGGHASVLVAHVGILCISGTEAV